jgi:tRNA threonylcarbamoyladenosine biosynthesis protein TsaE
MIDRVLLRTAAETATEAAGSSLARSLPKIPVTIGLSGDLGAGKTAFMRGFLRGLGFDGPVASPTYALEQRYATDRCDVVHVDLYRLEPVDAVRLLRENDGHDGIRCVEWPERAGEALRCDVTVDIAEETDGTRTIGIAFDDAAIPSDAQIEAWRSELRLPENIAAHCDAVGDACMRFAEALAERGVVARPALARAAGLTHDLCRFVDFHPGAAPEGYEEPQEDRAAWDAWKKAHPASTTHEQAAEAFLREHGFPELARIVAEHSVHFPVEKRCSVESHVLYYADKRFLGDRTVTVAERYHDFRVRYKKGVQTPENARWEQDALRTEALLFPDGPPF